MLPNEVVYERRPFEGMIDGTMRTFMDLMNTIGAEQGVHWSFAGGLPRDFYKGKPWNDYDVCIRDTQHARRVLEQMGTLITAQQNGGEIPHDTYSDPYSFSKSEIPVHWIEADDEHAFAPVRFDFSINQICLKPDGFFYAPTYAWRDLDKGIVRKTTERMTSNLATRAIRFAAKYDFTIDSDLNKAIAEQVTQPMGTDILLRNCYKMIEDGVEEQCFKMMKKRKFPHMEDCKTMDDYIRVLNNMIINGQGHREEIIDEGRY
jgi:hypothetical protein